MVATNCRSIKLYQFNLGWLLLSHVLARRFSWINFAPHERMYNISPRLSDPRSHLKLTASVNTYMMITNFVATQIWKLLISLQRKYENYYCPSHNTFSNWKQLNVICFMFHKFIFFFLTSDTLCLNFNYLVISTGYSLPWTVLRYKRLADTITFNRNDGLL